jgi:hypothetical protein
MKYPPAQHMLITATNSITSGVRPLMAVLKGALELYQGCRRLLYCAPTDVQCHAEVDARAKKPRFPRGQSK